MDQSKNARIVGQDSWQKMASLVEWSAEENVFLNLC